MKKKIITLCLVIALLSVAVIGGTLAYFTDVDQATNEFTVGNVDIDLYETVGHKDGAGNSKTNAITVIENGEKIDAAITEVVVDEETGKTEKIIKDLGIGDDTAFHVTYGPAMPGDVLTKTVTVENTEKEPTYVALSVVQHNYGPNYTARPAEGEWAWYHTNDFNVRIDDYYEGKVPESIVKQYKQEGRKTFVKYDDEQMQDLVDRLFTGDSWYDLSYTKGGEKANVRYYPTTAPIHNQAGNLSYLTNCPVDENNNPVPTLIAIDYAVPGNGHYNGNLLGADVVNEENVQVYNELPLNHRIWVYYLYLPAESKMTFDFEISVPVEIDEYSIGAFDGMTLDVRAAAIQASGFASAKEAFIALEKVYSFNYKPVPVTKEEEQG